MMVPRRYIIFVGLAVFFIIVFNFLREPLASRAGLLVPSNTGHGPGSSLPQQDAQPPTTADFRWDQVIVRYPVESLTPLPTGEPKRLPRVQHAFRAESPQQQQIRNERRAHVRGVFERCWNAYREHAWGHDELAPISGASTDGFGGWGASLVDNLDNLWIMGFKDEFEEAVATAVNIDLSKVTMTEINVFETTIRHLGGLLSAYDLSGDQRLLNKAKEFGEMLLVAFDTPNRLPITRWNPANGLKHAQEAHETVLVAEIGSLSMEFTRLSQLTGDMRWYDAVNRITQLFDQQQNDTLLQGMWPVTVNAKDANFTRDNYFTLSAMSDSLYEYFPKMYALTGGLDPIYRKLYEDSMKVAIKKNLYVPMTPDGADILISGSVIVDEDQTPHLDPQGQHLVCFAGGMFALGGRLFNLGGHVTIGKRLMNGCLWTYSHMPLGIMPEVFSMLPCPDGLMCAWNETEWRRAVAALHPDEPDIDEFIVRNALQQGFTDYADRRYLLRPEAIESVFVLYRVTGNPHLLDAAWDMLVSIMNVSQTPFANAALNDVSVSRESVEDGSVRIQEDSMESFWMAETLKYFYLIFSETDFLSLDEWVFNTEAHPFKREWPS